MDICIATPFLRNYGGMERVVLKIAKHFKAPIYVMDYKPDKTFPEFQDVDIIQSKKTFDSRLLSAAHVGYEYHKMELDHELVNAHQTPSEWLANKNPVLWYCHSPNREAFSHYQERQSRRGFIPHMFYEMAIRAYRHYEFESLPKLKGILTNSKTSKKRLRKFLGIDADVVSPGVDIHKFKFKEYGDFFFYPSRLTPDKDMEFAIKAHKRSGADMPLIIAGKMVDRAYYDKLCRMIKGHGKIVTDMSDDELVDHYARCRAVLYTPIEEDFGLVPLEAMASSKPCIAKDEGGPTETIEDRSDGYLCDSIMDMASAIKYLSCNEDTTKYLGKRGRTKAETLYTWDKFLMRFESKCKEALKS